MGQDNTWHGSRPRPRPHCVRWGPLETPQKGHSVLIFGPCLLWPNGCMDQEATWYGGRHRPRRHCVRCMGIQLPLKRSTAPSTPLPPSRKGAQQPPLFGQCLHGCPSQLLLNTYLLDSCGPEVFKILLEPSVQGNS